MVSWDVLRFTVEDFCDTVPKFSFGEPCGVSEKFRCRTNFCKRGRRVGFHEFPLNIFCLSVPKGFVGEPFGILDFFETRKNLYIRGGYHNSLSKIFLSQCQKISAGTLLCFRKHLVKKNLMHKKGSGILRFCVGSSLSHITEKILRGTFPGSKGSLV